jgi:ERCC4-related helicase
VQINYPIEIYNYVDCRLLSELQRVYVEYDLMKDPYVVDLIKKQQDGHDTSGALQKVFMSRKTYCNEQLRALASKAKDMADELGTSAVDWYLHQCKAQSEKMVHISDQQLFDWSVNEKQHLLALLTELPFTESTLHAPISLRSLSRKVETLIDLLAAEAKHSLEFTGLVFVEQRVWVAVLAEILSVHPRTRDVFRLGTFVGTSQSSKRKANIASFAEPRNQQTTLEDFRAGTTNLILATSVLEEGIDVSSCNLVVCFERPKNLKSFVQRRGRARKQKSKYFIFTPEDGTRPADAWQSLEAEMKATYEDDMREVLLAEQREQLDEEGARYFRVQKTG